MYDHVIWPEKYHPKSSPIYALNDIDVKAPAEVVWKMLVDVTNWAKHFPPQDQVKILSGETELALGTKFHRVRSMSQKRHLMKRIDRETLVRSEARLLECRNGLRSPSRKNKRDRLRFTPQTSFSMR